MRDIRNFRHIIYLLNSKMPWTQKDTQLSFFVKAKNIKHVHY